MGIPLVRGDKKSDGESIHQSSVQRLSGPSRDERDDISVCVLCTSRCANVDVGLQARQVLEIAEVEVRAAVTATAIERANTSAIRFNDTAPTMSSAGGVASGVIGS
jgi:hypothetical protein